MWTLELFPLFLEVLSSSARGQKLSVVKDDHSVITITTTGVPGEMQTSFLLIQTSFFQSCKKITVFSKRGVKVLLRYIFSAEDLQYL